MQSERPSLPAPTCWEAAAAAAALARAALFDAVVRERDVTRRALFDAAALDVDDDDDDDDVDVDMAAGAGADGSTATSATMNALSVLTMRANAIDDTERRWRRRRRYARQYQRRRQCLLQMQQHCRLVLQHVHEIYHSLLRCTLQSNY
jgi:HSP20 family molecular chaperone IbpA